MLHQLLELYCPLNTLLATPQPFAYYTKICSTSRKKTSDNFRMVSNWLLPKSLLPFVIVIDFDIFTFLFHVHSHFND